MAAELNGRWKARPEIWLTIIGWAVVTGINVGMLWNLADRVTQVEDLLVRDVRTRAEGDEIIKRFEQRFSDLDREILELKYGVQPKAVVPQRVVDPRPGP